MDQKKDILWRVYLLYGFMVLFAIAVFAQVVKVMFVEGDELRAKAQELTTVYKTIDAVRGNIYAADGSLLATSLPIYEVRMDTKADAITKEIFNSQIDSLAIQLAQLYPDKSAKTFKRELTNARSRGERYFLIRKNVRYTELKKIKKFPIFRLGRYKGGLIFTQQNRREMPFKNLAVRTLGYQREGVKPVGIEGAYNDYLTGVSGKRLMQRIAGNDWMPINDENEIEPQDGADLITNIDVNIQDVAQHALYQQLVKNKAHHGCAILMEVKTGAIKAIANLTRVDSSTYKEDYNYAIGEATEPGSTFKLPALMVAMEDGLLGLNDSVDTEGGKKMVHNQWIRDSHEGGYGVISAKKALEVSSNVAVAKLVLRAYAKKPGNFIDGLYRMGLNEKLGIELSGEAKPRVKKPKDKDWSAPTLAWTSFGYEVKQTPLQILTFYNAVANNGVMVRPQFVKEVVRKGKVVETFNPVVLNPAICSEATIRKAQKMLEGVVETGTGTSLKNPHYKIAGKTGTAQLAQGAKGYGNKENDKKKKIYQASFVGYFPAENPKYSCIVVVNDPNNNAYYAAQVAGPIFKEIADKVYSTSLEMHRDLDKDSLAEISFVPVVKGGSSFDFQLLTRQLAIPYKGSSSPWIQTVNEEKLVRSKALPVKGNKTPNVVGLSLKDALYVLENKGFHVKVRGRGAVKKQSVSPGTKISLNQEIVLELS